MLLKQFNLGGGQVVSLLAFLRSEFESAEVYNLPVKFCWKEQNYYKVNLSKRRSGSDCCSVGRVVAYDTRGQQFESSPWQIFIKNIYLPIVKCVEKTKIKKKRPEMAH